MRIEILCISVLRVALGPRVKLASCKSALKPPVLYSTDRSMAVVPVLVLLFVALWFILRGDLFYVLPCVILFMFFFSVFFALRLPRLGKRELILGSYVCLVFSVSSSSWCLGRAAVCDYGTPWAFLLPFFPLILYQTVRSFLQQFQYNQLVTMVCLRLNFIFIKPILSHWHVPLSKLN